MLLLPTLQSEPHILLSEGTGLSAENTCKSQNSELFLLTLHKTPELF